jgi:hypothetical protein
MHTTKARRFGFREVLVTELMFGRMARGRRRIA